MLQLAMHRQSKMVMNYEVGDTTYTKIFVGGLAWETQSHTMRKYFEKFGEIHEAVVITDRISGKSKGYGFVTFKDPESAKRACQDPYPVIDGRRANCNLAYLGAQKNHPQIHGIEKTRQPALSIVHGTSKYFSPPVPQYPVSYSALGYPTHTQHLDAMNAYGGQYYTNWALRFPAGVFINYYPFYAQNEQPHSSSPSQFHSQYHKMVQFPYMPFGIPSASPSPTFSAGTTTAAVKMTENAASQQNSSA